MMQPGVPTLDLQPWITDDETVVAAREQLLRALATLLKNASLDITARQVPGTPSQLPASVGRPKAGPGKNAQEATPSKQIAAAPASASEMGICTPTIHKQVPPLSPPRTLQPQLSCDADLAHRPPAPNTATAPASAAPLQGAWAGRSSTTATKAISVPLSVPKQMALANRLQGMPPSHALLQAGVAGAACVSQAGKLPTDAPHGPIVTSKQPNPANHATQTQKASDQPHSGIRLIRSSTQQATADTAHHSTPTAACPPDLAAETAANHPAKPPKRRILPASIQASSSGSSSSTPALNPWLKRTDGLQPRPGPSILHLAPDPPPWPTAAQPPTHTTATGARLLAPPPGFPQAQQQGGSSHTSFPATNPAGSGFSATSGRSGLIAQTSHPTATTAAATAAAVVPGTPQQQSASADVAGAHASGWHGMTGAAAAAARPASQADLPQPQQQQAQQQQVPQQPQQQPQQQRQSHTTVTVHASTWTPIHAQLAQLHAALLLHGHSHETTLDDVMQLISLLVTATHVPSPSTSSVSSATTCTLTPPPAANNGGGSGGGAVVVTQLLSQLLALIEGQAWAPGVVKQYVAQVLDRCAVLVCGLGHRMRDLLCDLPGLHVSCPALAARLEQAQMHAPKHPLRLPIKGAAVSSQPALPGSGSHPEGLRRKANRERARDCWHALARDASGLAAEVGDPAAQAALIQELQRMGTGRSAPVGRPSPALQHLQSLVGLQRRVQDMLSALHPDNLPFISDLFTASVLQAAATGQAVMEGAVASLAQQDPSRFARLSARLQPDSGPASRTHTSNQTSTSNQPQRTQRGRAGAPVAGDGGRLDGLAPAAPLLVGAGAAEDGAGQGAQLGKEFVFAGGECLTRTVLLLDEFEPVQRGFVLLCELSDSRAFANALGRCMAARLTLAVLALPGWQRGEVETPAGAADAADGPQQQQRGGGGARQQQPLGRPSPQQQRALQERMTSVITLSNYLSYLTHAHQPASLADAAQPCPPTSDAAVRATPLAPLLQPQVVPWPGATGCAMQLLQAAVGAGMLPLVMPCVAHLLWHVHMDPDVLQAGAVPGQARPQPEVRAALQALWQLRNHHPELQPSCTTTTTTYGVAAAAVRALIDGVLTRLAGAAGCKLHQLHQLLGFSCSSSLRHQPGTGYLQFGSPHPTAVGSSPGVRRRAGFATGSGRGSSVIAAEPAGSPDEDDAVGVVTPGGSRGDGGACPLGLACWDEVVDSWLLELCCPGLDGNCRRLQRAVVAAWPAAHHASLGSATATPSRPARPGLQPEGTPLAAEGPPALSSTLQRAESGPQPAASPLCLFSPARGAAGGARPAGAVPRKVNAVRVHTVRRTRAGLSLLPPAALLPPTWAALLQQDDQSDTSTTTVSTASTTSTASTASTAAVSQLQQALVAQYSGDDQAVKLKDVAAMVSDLVAANACALAFTQAIGPSLPQALQQLSDAAATHAAQLSPAPPPLTSQTSLPPPLPSHHHQTEPFPALPTPFSQPALPPPRTGTNTTGPQAALFMSAAPPAATSTVTTDPQLGLFTAAELDACSAHVAQAVDSVALQVTRGALASAERVCMAHVTRAVGAALGALLPASWPVAVHGCAAALTERMALATCAQRLVQQVPSLVLNHLQQHIEPVSKTALKHARLQDTTTPTAAPPHHDAATPLPHPQLQAAPHSNHKAQPAAPVMPATAPLGHAVCWVEVRRVRAEDHQLGDVRSMAHVDSQDSVTSMTHGVGQGGVSSMAHGGGQDSVSSMVHGAAAGVDLPCTCSVDQGKAGPQHDLSPAAAPGRCHAAAERVARALLGWLPSAPPAHDPHALSDTEQPSLRHSTTQQIAVLERALLGGAGVEHTASDVGDGGSDQGGLSLPCIVCVAQQVALQLQAACTGHSWQLCAALDTLQDQLTAAAAAAAAQQRGNGAAHPLPAALQPDRAVLSGLEATAHLLGHTVVCLFEQLVRDCHATAHTWAPARTGKGPAGVEDQGDASTGSAGSAGMHPVVGSAGMHPVVGSAGKHPVVVDPEVLQRLMKLPPRVVAVATDMGSYSVMRSMRAALQVATMADLGLGSQRLPHLAGP